MSCADTRYFEMSNAARSAVQRPLRTRMRQLSALSSVPFNLDSVRGRILRSSQLVAIQRVSA